MYGTWSLVMFECLSKQIECVGQHHVQAIMTLVTSGYHYPQLPERNFWVVAERSASGFTAMVRVLLPG